jgi:hypothetical protein
MNNSDGTQQVRHLFDRFCEIDVDGNSYITFFNVKCAIIAYCGKDFKKVSLVISKIIKTVKF